MSFSSPRVASWGTAKQGTAGTSGSPGPRSRPPARRPRSAPSPDAAPGRPRVSITRVRAGDGALVTVATFLGPVRYVLHNDSPDPGSGRSRTASGRTCNRSCRCPHTWRLSVRCPRRTCPARRRSAAVRRRRVLPGPAYPRRTARQATPAGRATSCPAQSRRFQPVLRVGGSALVDLVASFLITRRIHQRGDVTAGRQDEPALAGPPEP